MLGMSSCTLRRHAADGAIRTIRVGRRVLVPMDVMETVMVEEWRKSGGEFFWGGREKLPLRFDKVEVCVRSAPSLPKPFVFQGKDNWTSTAPPFRNSAKVWATRCFDGLLSRESIRH
jgi:hypothetical protein